MASVLYRCPTTGKNVQAWFDDDSLDDESLTYVSLRCPACARVHLVNRAGERPGDKH
jgi:DNA-directed RNA polymerase subunit RPC12/RpoP